MLRAPSRIHHGPLIAKLGPVDLQRPNTLDIPPHAQVGLLDLPVLQKDGAAEQRQDGIRQAILGQEQPRQHARHGGEEEEQKVRLHKSEIEGYLGAKQVTDLIEVFLAQQQALAEVHE